MQDCQVFSEKGKVVVSPEFLSKMKCLIPRKDFYFSIFGIKTKDFSLEIWYN